MSLNDKDVRLGELNDRAEDEGDEEGAEFDSQLQDEYGFDSHPPPGTEIGLQVARDLGSGSYAQDGRLEVAEDSLMMDGESLLGGGADITSQLETPMPSWMANLPSDKYHWNATDGNLEVFRNGFWYGMSYGDLNNLRYGPPPPPRPKNVAPLSAVPPVSPAPQDAFSQPMPTSVMTPSVMTPSVALAPSVMTPSVALAPSVMTPSVVPMPVIDDSGPREARRAAALTALSKLSKAYAQKSPTANKEYQKVRAAIAAIGSAIMSDEVGSAAMYGPTEVGGYADEGADEIGCGLASASGASEIGQFAEEGADEIGTHADVQAPFESFMLDDVHMGAAAAVVKVVQQARDNRQPPPPMKAVDEDADSSWDTVTEQDLTEALIGAAVATGHPDPFPLTSKFMLRAGGGMEPRYVRVDSEESYKQFRTEHSPELSELKARLDAHIADPHAHEQPEFADELSDDVEDLVMLGAEATAAEEEKRVELWMPRHFDGHVTAWREGEYVCASMKIPGLNGEVKICTTLEPMQKCIAEMSHHASQAGVPASSVVGVLPAMGCVLGAGTALKEMAAAAPSIVQKDKATPFVLRVEPKVSPALTALAMLAMAVRKGNAQAAAEWKSLAALAPAPVKQAMTEAVQVAKAAE